MTDSVENLLSRLDGVKAKGKGRWGALCPAHPDKNPSLSVKETDDGTILLKCWSGCSALDVVQSVGLGIKDLFPVQPNHHHPRVAYHQRINADYRKLVKHLSVDLTVIIVSASDVIRGQFNQDDMPRLVEADQRVRRILGAANVK